MLLKTKRRKFSDGGFLEPSGFCQVRKNLDGAIRGTRKSICGLCILLEPGGILITLLLLAPRHEPPCSNWCRSVARRPPHPCSVLGTTSLPQAHYHPILLTVRKLITSVPENPPRSVYRNFSFFFSLQIPSPGKFPRISFLKPELGELLESRRKLLKPNEHFVFSVHEVLAGVVGRTTSGVYCVT